MAESDMDSVVAMAAVSRTAPHWPRKAYEQAVDEEAIPARIALVAEAKSGELAGFVVANVTPPEAELESIVVAEAFRRQGSARALVGALLEALRMHSVSTVHLEVRSSNQGALALYAAAGFKQSGIRKRYYADPVEDGVLFSLDLG